MAQFTNQATLSYNGLSVTSNVASGEIVEVLTVTKTATPATYETGDNVTYIISVVNSGTTDVTDVTLTDDLGAYAMGEETLYPLSYVDATVKLYRNGTLQATPTVTAGPPLVISGLVAPAGGNLIIIYTASVTSSAPLGIGATIENTVTVDGTGTSAITASATVVPAQIADLTITKSVSPVSVTENGTLTYTFLSRTSARKRRQLTRM